LLTTKHIKMSPIQILRVENSEGIGMFMSNTFDAYDVIPGSCERHFQNPWMCTSIPFPRPCNDNLNIYLDDKEWFCAFLSLEQFNTLIYPDEVKKLIEVGYTIKLLTVTEYQKGGHQVLYTKESILDSRDLNSLF
jgi:hypothetical protein